MNSGWTTKDIPDQRGKLAVVTGSTAGIGLEVARELAAAGADVVLAARNAAKAAAVIADLRHDATESSLRFEMLDLGQFGSVRAFASRLLAEGRPVDILVNNAGLMRIPERQLTEDGWERQFATNHLGHFLLTAELWPLMRNGPASRVVNVASTAHRRGRIDFANLNGERRYGPSDAYSRSKLAVLMFSLELQRRIGTASVASIAAHPGLAATDLLMTGRLTGRRSGPGIGTRLLDRAFRLLGQSAAAGALPVLLAATAAEANPGGYYGPDGFLEFQGSPARAIVSAHGLDAGVRSRLWAELERMVGRAFDP